MVLRININRFITSELFIVSLFRLSRIYVGTFRLTIENEQEWLDYLNSGGTVLICAWHQHIFPGIRHFGKYKIFKPSLMISQSKDGEIVARVAVHNGWNPIRGSSSQGGMSALKNMIASLKKSRLCAHIVDGPRGPSGVVKPGVIRLAHATNAAIVPFYTFAEHGWNFNSWDKFLLPKPFSKVTLRFGKMIYFKRVKGRDPLEKQRKQLEDTMIPALSV